MLLAEYPFSVAALPWASWHCVRLLLVLRLAFAATFAWLVRLELLPCRGAELAICFFATVSPLFL